MRRLAEERAAPRGSRCEHREPGEEEQGEDSGARDEREREREPEALHGAALPPYSIPGRDAGFDAFTHASIAGSL